MLRIDDTCLQLKVDLVHNVYADTFWKDTENNIEWIPSHHWGNNSFEEYDT